MKSNAQVSVEYLVILSLVLVFIGILFTYSQTIFSDAITLQRATDSIKELAGTANQAYGLGPGTRLYAYVTVPDNIEEAYILDEEIGYVISLSSGENEIYEEVSPQIVGSIPNNPGTYYVLVEVLENGTVRIGESSLDDFTPPVILLVAPPNGSTDTDGIVSFDFSVDDLNSGIVSCELIIDGAVDQTKYSVTKGVTQSFSKTFSLNGTYIWDVNCTDDSVNANEGTSGSPRSIIINITVIPDTEPPIIYLESPASGYVDSDGIIQFDYNVIDVNSGIASCELLINGLVNQTDNTITEGITQSFNVSGLANNSYTWDVNCTDDSINSNEGSSNENRPFTVSTLPTMIAFDDFEGTGNWNGGLGWLYNWYTQGDARRRTQAGPHSPTHHARLRRSTGYMDRAVDLSGAIDPYLEVWVKINSFESADHAFIRVSPNDTQWYILKDFTSADSNNSYTKYTFRLLDYSSLSSEFWIAFDAQMSGGGDYYYVDDVNIVERG